MESLLPRPVSCCSFPTPPSTLPEAERNTKLMILEAGQWCFTLHLRRLLRPKIRAQIVDSQPPNHLLNLDQNLRQTFMPRIIHFTVDQKKISTAFIATAQNSSQNTLIQYKRFFGRTTQRMFWNLPNNVQQESTKRNLSCHFSFTIDRRRGKVGEYMPRIANSPIARPQYHSTPFLAKAKSAPSLPLLRLCGRRGVQCVAMFMRKGGSFLSH